jgi:serine/threonine protein kinase
MVPLWLDQLEAKFPPLRPHLLHPYRAPEQVRDARDYDTRSDVYSFALVLLQMLTGTVPFLGGMEPAEVLEEWPEGLGPLMRRCLARDRTERCKDGVELYDLLRRVTGLAPLTETSLTGLPAESAEPEAEVEAEPSPEEEDLEDEDTAQIQVEEARALVRDGRLAEALDVLESLPPGTPGRRALLDEIAQRHDESNVLAAEAVRLAGMGHTDAAAEALSNAEELSQQSENVRTVRTDLAGADEQMPLTTADAVMQRLKETLDREDFEGARPLLENLIRNPEARAEIADLVSAFKKGRVRAAIRENIRQARRSYLQGDHRKSAHHWREVSRWLPPGPHREALRAIAKAAGEGTLQLDAEELATAVVEEQPPAAPTDQASLPSMEVQQKLDALRREAAIPDRRRLLVLLFVLALAVGIGLALVLAIWL